jgi:hypothetical protein
MAVPFTRHHQKLPPRVLESVQCNPFSKTIFLDGDVSLQLSLFSNFGMKKFGVLHMVVGKL